MNFAKKIILLLIILLVNASHAYAQSMMPIPEGTNYLPKSQYGNDDLNLPPEAIIKVRNNTGNKDQLSGTTATTFTFNGNGSYDDKTSSKELEVRFDFENDGVIDTYFSQRKYEKHQYETPGRKIVKMEILDLAGNISSTTQNIYIVENTKPEAHFTISPKIGTPGTIFKLNTKLSTDSQYSSNQLIYRFDFDGDGIYDTKFKSKEVWNHKFPKPGLKNVKVEVRDPEGAIAHYSQMIFIKANKTPSASFNVEIIKRREDSTRLQLDASNSHDPENLKLKYKWDYDYTGKNDIRLNTPWYSSSKTYVNFYKSGKYIIRLLVRDKDGATDETFKTIFVDLLTD